MDSISKISEGPKKKDFFQPSREVFLALENEGRSFKNYFLSLFGVQKHQGSRLVSFT